MPAATSKGQVVLQNSLHLYARFDLRDILSQIGECLSTLGYEKTREALEKETAKRNVKIDIDAWRDLAADNRSDQPITLAELWNSYYEDDSLPRPSLGESTTADESDSDDDAISEAVNLTPRHAKLKDKISTEASGSSSGSDMMERAAPKGEREETPLASESESSDSEADAHAGASQDDDSDSDSSSDSDGDSSASQASAKVGQKRKRVMTPGSSDDSSSESGSESEHGIEEDAKMSSGSESESDSSSSDSEDSRPTKRTKLAKDDKSSDSGSSSSDSGSSSSSGSSKAKKKTAKKTKKTSSKSSSSSSDSDSDSSSSASNKSGSSSDSSSNNSIDSSSDSSSDGKSGSSRSRSPKRKVKNEKRLPKSIETLQVPKIERTGSATSSSATLEATSPVRPKVEKATDTLLVHDAKVGHKELPATKENIKKLKKEQVPFSRIPTDTKVDPKFASNAYVPYDYANRAYQDLSVTKGKGFTKEKNKKKRGAYRGGAIDLAPKAIKFED